jgi:hypothetical protein
MDPIALEKAFELYPDVRLVVIAHLYGTPGKMDELKSVCDRHISVKIRSQLDVKRKNGKFIGSFACYGYDKDPKDSNHIIIDPYQPFPPVPPA